MKNQQPLFNEFKTSEDYKDLYLEACIVFPQ